MNIFFYDSPLGKLAIADDGDFITEIYPVDKNIDLTNYIIKETPLIKKAFTQVTEFLNGFRKKFELPLNPKGTEFQKSVWNELKKIPYGETRTYGDIAKSVGNPKAARAVGMANNKNPILLAIPCHRVIGANGNLVGFGCGIDMKEKLLKMEGSIKC